VGAPEFNGRATVAALQIREAAFVVNEGPLAAARCGRERSGKVGQRFVDMLPLEREDAGGKRRFRRRRPSRSE
jgi:hypothetical protein